MSTENFFKDQSLPFVECRYSTGSKREYKSHIHSTFSIGALDSGKVQYKVTGQQSTLKAGSLALINPEEVHSCNAVTEKGRSYFMLYLVVLVLSKSRIKNHLGQSVLVLEKIAGVMLACFGLFLPFS